MGTSQRISRSFHRLAMFSAAIALLLGGLLAVFLAVDKADNAQREHDTQMALICAKEAIYQKFYKPRQLKCERSDGLGVFHRQERGGGEPFAIIFQFRTDTHLATRREELPAARLLHDSERERPCHNFSPSLLATVQRSCWD